MGVLVLINDPSVASPAPSVARDDPPDNRISAERNAKRFTISRPHLLLRNHSPEGSLHRSPQNNQERKIEPDEMRGPGPGDVSRVAVVAIQDPLRDRDLLRNFLQEFDARRMCPSRPPEDGIKLNVRNRVSLRYLSGNRRLSRAASPHHNNAQIPIC